MIVINFKNYKHGSKVSELINEIERVNDKIICCLSALDLYLAKRSKLKIFSQHSDFCDDKRHTGSVCVGDLKSIGVLGSLLNHSEYPVDFKTIKKINEERGSFKLILCASSIYEAKKLKKLNPWAICYEDPKLIAGKKSIVESESEKVRLFAKLLLNEKIIALCGAGIHGAKDYERAIELGCDGVLVSSSVMRNSNPIKIIKELSRVKSD